MTETASYGYFHVDKEVDRLVCQKIKMCRFCDERHIVKLAVNTAEHVHQ